MLNKVELRLKIWGKKVDRRLPEFGIWNRYNEHRDQGYIWSWCLRFARNIGLCNTYEVEFWGILDGLKQVWEHDCCDGLLETNCLKALYHVKGTLVIHKSDSYVIHAIRDLLRRDWDISIRYEHWKCNRMVDYLAKTTEWMVISFYS